MIHCGAYPKRRWTVNDSLRRAYGSRFDIYWTPSMKQNETYLPYWCTRCSWSCHCGPVQAGIERINDSRWARRAMSCRHVDEWTEGANVTAWGLPQAPRCDSKTPAGCCAYLYFNIGHTCLTRSCACSWVSCWLPYDVKAFIMESIFMWPGGAFPSNTCTSKPQGTTFRHFASCYVMHPPGSISMSQITIFSGTRYTGPDPMLHFSRAERHWSY